jgi:hypothetical protein
MCLTPNLLPGGELVACHKCEICRKNKVNDWIGRCVAESKMADHTASVTLTYGRNETGESLYEQALYLTYSDVQKYFKKLRAAGFKFKYLVAGEYGSRKGRAHWHALLFFEGAVPDYENEKRVFDTWWPHGYSFWQRVTGQDDDGLSVEEVVVSGISYVCKYVQKDAKDPEKQGMLRMSKKPPLGSGWFLRLAQRYVDDGLAPRDLFYSFADVVDRETGKRRQYMIPPHSATATLFFEEWLRLWQKTYPGKHPPHAEALEKYLDKKARAEMDRDPDLIARDVVDPLPIPKVPEGAAGVRYDDVAKTYLCDVGAEMYYVSVSTDFKEEGKSYWRKSETKDPVQIGAHVNSLRRWIRDMILIGAFPE